MHDIDSAGNKMGRYLIIHFLLPFSIESAKLYRRVGRAEKPNGSAFQTIPEPNGAEREIQHVHMPQLPFGDSVKKVLHLHFGLQK
jgi:hypothetical protein